MAQRFFNFIWLFCWPRPGKKIESIGQSSPMRSEDPDTPDSMPCTSAEISLLREAKPSEFTLVENDILRVDLGSIEDDKPLLMFFEAMSLRDTALSRDRLQDFKVLT